MGTQIFWITHMAEQNAPRKHKIGKIEIPPASFQRSEAIKLDVSTSTEEKTTNQKRWVSDPKTQLVLIPSQVLVPLHRDGKWKWNQEICKLKKSNMMRSWVRPRGCHNDGCQSERDSSPRPLTDPRTSRLESMELPVPLALISGERQWSMKDTNHWMLPMREILPKCASSLWVERRMRERQK